MSVIVSVLEWILANPKIVSAAMASPKLKNLFFRLGVEIYFELRRDPEFESQIKVLEKTLEDPDLTFEERQNVEQQIQNLHPKS